MTPSEPQHYLHGKTAIITGAGRGIGRAIALRLAASGARVVITSRTSEQLDETRKLIERAGGTVLSVTSDVTNPEQVDSLVKQARTLTGNVDILINNAGIAPMATIDKMTPEVFDQMMAVNIRSVYLCSRAVWQSMSKQGGTIINIASMAAYDPFPGLGAYGASKAFVVAFTRGLATEGAPHNIRVFGIAPGAVETEMLRGVVPDFPASQALAPDDIAALAELLLSPACRHSSGETIKIMKS